MLRVDSQLFMAHHREAHEEGGKFAHSAYTNGKPVACAGEIAIADGVVLCVTTGSGHYAPRSSHMLEMLRFLARQDVRMTGVLVGVYKDGDFAFYDYGTFVSAGGDTRRIEQSRHKKSVFQRIPGWVEGMVQKSNELQAPFMQPGDQLTTAEDIWRNFR